MAYAQHVGPAQLYPDQALTPGKADTIRALDLHNKWACQNPPHKVTCTYSQAHRDVSRNVRRRVYNEYKVPAPDRNTVHGEVDHFDPLCNGGSNDATNLWYQPATNMWNGKNFGYHQKDKLEDWVCGEVKAGRLDPGAAFKRIQVDWVKFYLELPAKTHRSRKPRH